MNVPAIGAARGLFDIFVPGLFLLVNVGLALYLLPFTDDASKRLIAAVAANAAVSVVLGICFGYLAGVLLRIFRCERPDVWSAWWLEHFDSGARDTHGVLKPYLKNRFPYIEHLGTVCESLPKTAREHYERCWQNSDKKGGGRNFINFCKTMVAAGDPQAAAELYAAEALTRYLAGMWYALLASCALMVLVTAGLLAATGRTTLLPPVLAVVYAYAITAILGHYRLIRIKEVEQIFAVCVRNRSAFESAEFEHVR